MYKIALILNDRVQHIGTYKALPQFAPPLVTVDITNYVGEVKEGYLYDEESGVFIESTTPIPEEPEQQPRPPTLEEKLAELLVERDKQIQSLKEQQLRTDADLAGFMDFVLMGGM